MKARCPTSLKNALMVMLLIESMTFDIEDLGAPTGANGFAV